MTLVSHRGQAPTNGARFHGVDVSGRFEDDEGGEADERVFFDVELNLRGFRGLGVEIEFWEGDCVVTGFETDGAAASDGRIQFGDVIYLIDGRRCTSVDDLTGRNDGTRRLRFFRQPVKYLLESEVQMVGPDGEMEPYTLQILSNRMLEFERVASPEHGCVRASNPKALAARARQPAAAGSRSALAAATPLVLVT